MSQADQMNDDTFWGGQHAGGPASGFAIVPGHGSHLQPTTSQRSQRSLPGPAGRLAAAGAQPQPAASGVSYRGAALVSSVPAASSGRLMQDPDFQSQQWRQAVEEGGAPFDEDSDPYRGNTVRAASELQKNGVLDRMLAVVVGVKRCYSGEAFVRLKDPTGSIGGTLTRTVLENEPDVRQGAVLRLRRVTVLRTPPPRSVNHLCITLDSVVQVIPPPLDSSQVPGSATVAASEQQQQPRRIFPALPAPSAVAAAPAPAPAASWLAPPSVQPPPQQQQQPHLLVQQAQQQQAWQQQQPFGMPMPGPPAQCHSHTGMPSPPARQPQAPAAAPSSSFAWPSLAPPRQPPPPPQQQQQQLPRSTSIAWPSLQQGGAAAAVGGGPPRPGARQQLPAQPAASESVNFSMPAFSQPDHPLHQLACQDDASSMPGGQGTAASPAAGTQRHTAGGAGAGRGAGAGWLQGLLAEAQCPVFLLGSQASQPLPGATAGRLPLVERQQQQRRQQQQFLALGGEHPAKRSRQQLQQHSPPQLGAAGPVFADVDALDLDE